MIACHERQGKETFVSSSGRGKKGEKGMDELLLHRAQRGDPDAFEAALKAAQDELDTAVEFINVDEADADNSDAINEGYEKAQKVFDAEVNAISQAMKQYPWE